MVSDASYFCRAMNYGARQERSASGRQAFA
jgi:hypothetical protein